MGVKYLWDTNTVIYFLQDLLTKEGEVFINNVLRKSSPAISVITEIELLCWKTANENDLHILRSFIKDCVIFELTDDIKLLTAEIRKTSRAKLPDAIIAATAKAHKLELITRNVNDFAKISNLKIHNPFDK